MALYKGFSTIGRTRRFKLTDNELIKQDLINHFHTRQGEKLMNPEFGSIIWATLYEPLTDSVKQSLVEDVDRIIKSDPRVMANDILVTEYEQGIQIQVDIQILPTNVLDTMVVQFDKTAKTTTLV